MKDRVGDSKLNNTSEERSSSRGTDSFTKISRAFSTWLPRPSSPSEDEPGAVRAEPVAKGVSHVSHIEGGGVFLPAVHSVHGDQLQWNIFHRQLVASLTKVCSQLKLNLPDAQESLTNTARQFK